LADAQEQGELAQAEIIATFIGSSRINSPLLLNLFFTHAADGEEPAGNGPAQVARLAEALHGQRDVSAVGEVDPVEEAGGPAMHRFQLKLVPSFL
jgi:hypothetical protein